MPRRIVQMIGLLMLLACEPGEPRLDVSVHMSAVIAPDAARAVVVLYPAAPPTSCEVLRLSERDETAPQRGSHHSEVLLEEPPPHYVDFFDLVPGDYQIAVFVYDGSDDLIGFGCLPAPVTIELGKYTEAPVIDVREVPVT